MGDAMRPDRKYTFDLPFCEREALCRVLDVDRSWRDLAGLMQFSVMEIKGMELLELSGKSPSDKLLIEWRKKNHTILKLFSLLSKLRHFQAMLILKPFVDPKYHGEIYEGEQSCTIYTPNGCNSADKKFSPPVNGAGPSSYNAADKIYGGSNLNFMQPDVHKPKKTGFGESSKIQNNGSPVSLEENNSSLPENGEGLRLPHAPQSPSVQIGALGQPQLPSQTSDYRDVSMETNVLPKRDYKELEAATNGWNPCNILGKGGFGTVYRGLWKNTDVAIKRIEFSKGDSPGSCEVPYKQSINELRVLQTIHHENILQLYSFSLNGDQPCLVYQFMENGSLEDRLQCRNKTNPLTWQQRYNIVKGAARGLQYMHTILDKPFIHGDIKSANILLGSNFEPRIGDFGLVREGPQSQFTSINVTTINGTKPYLPIDYFKDKKLSTKVDTYSFGVVLFEVATGLRAFDDKRKNKKLRDEVVKHPDVKQLMDPKVVKAFPIFEHLINLGKSCVMYYASQRPEMGTVCQKLDEYTVTLEVLPTPMEMQETYDKKHEQPRLPIPNSWQPMSGQPGSSNSGNPAPWSPTVNQTPLGTAAPARVASQDGFRQMGPAGQGTSRSSVPNQSTPLALYVDNSVSLKNGPSDSSPTVRKSSRELMLSAELPAVLLGPKITVVSATESERSSASSYSDNSTHSSQPTSYEPPKEIENSAEELGGYIPNLSILNIHE